MSELSKGITDLLESQRKQIANLKVEIEHMKDLLGKAVTLRSQLPDLENKGRELAKRLIDTTRLAESQDQELKALRKQNHMLTDAVGIYQMFTERWENTWLDFLQEHTDEIVARGLMVDMPNTKTAESIELDDFEKEL